MLSEFTDDQKISIKKCIGKPPKTETMLKNALKPAKIFNLLLKKGLIFQIPGKGKRKSRFDFTEEAVELFKSVETPKPKRASRKKRATKRVPKQTLDTASLEPLIVGIVDPYLKDFEIRIIALEKKLDYAIGLTKATKEFSIESFRSSLRSHYEKINTEERRGGMVPVPKLWDKLQIDGFSRNDFVSGLFELERQRTIELQTASDPKVVRDAEKAIDHPSRGLINYVIWRR